MFLSNVKSVPEVAEMIILVKLVEVDQVRPVAGDDGTEAQSTLPGS